MKKWLMLVTLLAVGAVGCATTQKAPAEAPAPQAAVYPQPFCMPCEMPCTTPCPKPVPPAPKPPPPPPPPPEPAASATFQPAGGTFTGPVMVTPATATPGGELRCTTDGTPPTAETPVTTPPIRVETTATLQCITTAPGLPPSAVASANYTILPSRVEFTTRKLELREKVMFATGKTTIDPRSYPLLDDVASALNAHSEAKKVVIEGHTDSTGGAKVNQKLSQGRADSVKAYLVQKGVDPERLEAKGFGPARAIASNKTKDGREANRRVEFVVAEMGQQ